MKNAIQTLSSARHPFAARLVPTIFLAFALSASQAQSPDLTAAYRHIPADADQVISINLSTLVAKADFQAIFDLAQKQNLGKGMNMSFLKDIFNSGIDFRQEILIAIKPSASPDSPSYTTGIIHLTDSAKFVAFTRANDKDMHILHLPGNVRAAASGKQAWAWNDKFLVLVMYKTPKGKPVDPNATLQYHATAARKAAAALHGFEHSSYLTDPDFKAGFSDDADIHIWNKNGAAFGALSKLMQMTPAAATPQAQGFSQIMKSASKAHTLTTIRFDAGKIVLHSTRFTSGSDSSIATRISSQPVDPKMLASVPPGKLLGIYAVHYSFAPVLESLAKYGMKEKVDSGLQKIGLTTQDITHAFKGDIMVLCYAPDTGKNPQFFVAAAIDDRSAFDKITTILKLGTSTDTAKKHFDPHFAIQNNIVVFAKSQALADGYFSHPSGGNTQSRLITERSKTDANFMAVDIHVGADYLSQILTKGDTLAAKDQKVLDMVRQFDSFVLMGGNVQNGRQQAVFELRFTDANKNALASILGIVGKAAAMK